MVEEEMKGPGGDSENLVQNPSIIGGPIETLFPTWKLYDNPFYYSCYHHSHLPLHRHHHHRHHDLDPDLVLDSPTSHQQNQDHLPTTSFSQPMDHAEDTSDQLRHARARIKELTAEIELERRLRKKGESLNKALARELSEERKAAEAKKRECEELIAEVTRVRKDMDRLRKEVEEERKMLRVAEVLREERVQMKLSEARIVMEEKLREISSSSSPSRPKADAAAVAPAAAPSPSANGTSRMTSAASAMRGWWENSSSNDSRSSSSGSTTGQQRKEVENPHIKRGIRGFVEFPRVVRSRANGLSGSPSGSREGKGNLCPKLECQKAQLRVLLKQRVPLGLGSSGTENLVM